MKYLSSIGLSAKDETVLKSLIDLLGARTSEEWIYRDDVMVDALLLDFDNSEAVAAWNTKPESVRRNTIAYSSEIPGISFARRLAKPLRAADLIAVLKDIEENPGKADKAPASSTPPPSTQAPSEISTLAECVARHSEGLLRLTFGDREVVLDRQRRCFSTSESGESLAALLAHPFQEFQVTRGADVNLPPDGSIKWLDQKALLWLVGQSGSHGRLIDGLEQGGLFRITRWPGFGLVRPSQTVLTLCSMLTRKNAMSIEDIRSVSGVPEFDIIAFINAASLTGILVAQSGDAAKPDKPAAKPELPTERKGLFAKIRSRLANTRA